MQKIVVNNTIGSFTVSIAFFNIALERNQKYALDYLKKRGNPDPQYPDVFLDIERDDPLLIEYVENYNDIVSVDPSQLVIIEMPDDVEWEVYANEMRIERVEETHRMWLYEEIP